MSLPTKLFVIAILSCAFGCVNDEPVDIETERQAILETDRAWASAAAAGNVQELVSFWADDAINFFPDQPVAEGKEAIRNLVRNNRSRPGFALVWEPQEAFVADSGDLGYSYGTFNLSFESPDAQQIAKQGHYVCIWRKQDDGSWKCAVESTIFGPSPK